MRYCETTKAIGVSALYPAELVSAVAAVRHHRSVTNQQTSVAMRQTKKSPIVASGLFIAMTPVTSPTTVPTMTA